MVYSERHFTLKNGEEIYLRSPKKEDAPLLLELLEETAKESPFTGRNPGELKMTLEQEEQFLEAISNAPNQLLLLVFKDQQLLGSSQINFYKAQKFSHRALVALALRKAHWNKGLGSLLMQELEKIALEMEAKLLELEVIDGNERALKLYKKMGYKLVGRKPAAVKLSDGYVDELLMVKEL